MLLYYLRVLMLGNMLRNPERPETQPVTSCIGSWFRVHIFLITRSLSVPFLMLFGSLLLIRVPFLLLIIVPLIRVPFLLLIRVPFLLLICVPFLLLICVLVLICAPFPGCDFLLSLKKPLNVFFTGCKKLHACTG